MNKKLLLGVCLLSLAIMIRFSPLGSYLTFENLVANKEWLHQTASSNYLMFVLVYIAIYIMAVAASFPGAAILTMAGGFIFGTIATTVFVSAAATVGACGAFLAVRHLVGNHVQQRYADSLVKFNSELAANGYSYLLTIRLIPIFPFFVINFLAALTNVSLFTFTWTTFIGIIPGTIAYAFVGSRLNYIESPQDILSKEVLIAFLVLALLAILPTVIKKFRGNG